jgi:AcrR family transcriptional regulator
MSSSGQRTAGGPTPAGRRLPRAQRREQVLAAATEAFARAGFAATSLADVAREAGVTRMIVYTHFESKTALYQAALDRMRDKLRQATGAPDYSPFSLAAMLRVAAAEPAGFRLLFHHAAREPEFRDEIDRIRASRTAIAADRLGPRVTDPAWARWLATLVPTFTIEAAIAWLDAGQPDDPDRAAARIARGIAGIVAAAGDPT